MNSPAVRLPSRQLAVLSIVAFGMALLAWKCVLALSDPSFDGDEPIRLFYVSKPVFRLGNRVWLPFLQLHIWVLYLFRTPSLYFRLIPCVYFFVAVLSYGLLALRLLGRTYSGLLFSLVLMFCFAQHRTVSRLSTALYQEIIGMAFLYLLLCLGALTLRKSGALLALGAVAMLVRDSFAIYLLALTALNWRAIRPDGGYRRAFLVLWAVPVVWYLSIPAGLLIRDGRLPRSPVEWPLMINKGGGMLSGVGDSVAAVWRALLSTNALYLGAALAAAWLISRGPRSGEGDEFGRSFARFSLVSLLITYLAIALFHPWQATGGSSRIAVPLLEHLFVWVLVVLAGAQSSTRLRRMAAQALVLGGLAISLNRQAAAWAPRPDPELSQTYRQLEKLVYSSTARGRPTVCFGAGEQFGIMDRFAAPTLYARHILLQPEDAIPAACSAVIARPQALPAGATGLEKAWEFHIGGESFVIYRRQDR